MAVASHDKPKIGCIYWTTKSPEQPGCKADEFVLQVQTLKTCGNFTVLLMQVNKTSFNVLSHCAIFRATCLATHYETSCTKHCTSVHTWQRSRLTAQQSGKLLEIVAESRTVFYFEQWFLQLVSQHFRPLQGIGIIKRIDKVSYTTIR